MIGNDDAMQCSHLSWGKYKLKTSKIQAKYKQNMSKIRAKYRQNTGKIRAKYSKDWWLVMMMQCMSQSPMLRGAPVHNERRYVFGFIYISAHIQLSFVFLYIISLLEIFGQGINSTWTRMRISLASFPFLYTSRYHYSMFCHIHTS